MSDNICVCGVDLRKISYHKKVWCERKLINKDTLCKCGHTKSFHLYSSDCIIKNCKCRKFEK